MQWRRAVVRRRLGGSPRRRGRSSRRYPSTTSTAADRVSLQVDRKAPRRLHAVVGSPPHHQPPPDTPPDTPPTRVGTSSTGSPCTHSQTMQPHPHGLRQDSCRGTFPPPTSTPRTKTQNLHSTSVAEMESKQFPSLRVCRLPVHPDTRVPAVAQPCRKPRLLSRHASSRAVGSTSDSPCTRETCVHRRRATRSRAARLASRRGPRCASDRAGD